MASHTAILFVIHYLLHLMVYLIGTTYFQIGQAFLVVSGMCVFSTASALFMFPAMYLYYKPALEVYKFEKADGVGRPHDIVLQGFVRFMFIAFFPIVLSVTVIYLLVSSKYAVATLKIPYPFFVPILVGEFQIL